jgi:hypothetical protein
MGGRIFAVFLVLFFSTGNEISFFLGFGHGNLAGAGSQACFIEPALLSLPC